MAAPERARASVGREQLVEELRGRLAAISDGKFAAASIDPAANVFDYGYVDSLSAVMFLAHIEETYGVSIDDVELVERCNTLDAIADHICRSA